jgi:hypothetical protein
MNWYLFNVAPAGSRPYRGLAIREPFDLPQAKPAGSRRYSRLPARATGRSRAQQIYELARPLPPASGISEMNSRLLFTIAAAASRMSLPAEKLLCRRRVNQKNGVRVMGDKSPKSTQKKSGQKQAKAISMAQKKKEAVASKQVAGKKK